MNQPKITDDWLGDGYEYCTYDEHVAVYGKKKTENLVKFIEKSIEHFDGKKISWISVKWIRPTTKHK